MILGVIALFVALVLVLQLFTREIKGGIQSTAVTVFGVIYITLFFSHIILMKAPKFAVMGALQGPWRTTRPLGLIKNHFPSDSYPSRLAIPPRCDEIVTIPGILHYNGHAQGVSTIDPAVFRASRSA